MEWIRSFVHSTIQQFGDAELLNAPSYFIRCTAQDVISLEGEEVRCLQSYRTPHIKLILGQRDLWQHETTYHATSHGRCEEDIPVLDVEVLQTVLLEGSCEEIGLFGDQVLTGVEVLGDEGEKAPR